MTPSPKRTASPTPRALALACGVTVLAAGLGMGAPARWPLAFIGAVLLAGAVLADFALALRAPEPQVTVIAPAQLRQGEEAEVRVRAEPSAPALEAALDVDARLAVSPRRRSATDGEARFRLRAVTRGLAALQVLQLRWTGPLGLVWRQLDLPLARTLPVAPDLAPARAASRALTERAPAGVKTGIRLGQGGEFSALRDHAAGDDRRNIDWKRSAARGRLLAKEHQLEQNHSLVLALDTGRQMAEPLVTRSRLDHALSAALALVYASLSVGDRVKLVGFDAKVLVDTPFAAGTAQFNRLQAAAAGLEASTEATNYTLALHTVASALKRRALIVVFTEFTDTVGAELMLESISRLVRRHAVMFVVFRDAELESMILADPERPEDVSRAVVAAGLKRERALVLERLRRIGVRAVETTPARMGGAIIDAYLDLKRLELG